MPVAYLLADGAATATTDMATFLGIIGTFFTQCITWLSTCLTTIVNSPALTVLCLAMPICGFAVGLLGRLIRVN